MVTFLVSVAAICSPGVQAGYKPDTLLFRNPAEASSISPFPVSRPPEALRKMRESVYCMQPDFCGKFQLYNRLWAQDMVSADLMRQQLREWKVQPKIRMAIVDSGFDTSLYSFIEHKRVAPLVELSKTLKLYAEGNPSDDPLGHGTPIMGLAEGKEVGIYPTGLTTVYKARHSGVNLYDDLDGLTKQACEDGNSIIVNSFGTIADQETGHRFETTGAQTLRELNRKGCIVVKSAGNDQILSYQQTFSPDLYDNFHRIQAISPEDYQAGFSSAGESAAPGESVFTLQSLDRPIEPPVRCAGLTLNEFTQVSGTSFSGPIYAEILQAVIDVLMQHHQGKSLGTEDLIKRNAIAVRVMRSSRIRSRGNDMGSVNGLLAVHAAKAMQNWRSLSLAEIERLDEESSIRTAARLTMPRATCTEIDRDPFYLRCISQELQCQSRCRMDALRRHQVLCENPNKSLMSELVELHLEKGDLVGAYRIKPSIVEVQSESKIVSGVTHSLELRFDRDETREDFNQFILDDKRPYQVKVHGEFLADAKGMLRYMTEWLFETNQTLGDKGIDYTHLAEEILATSQLQSPLGSVPEYSVTYLVKKLFLYSPQNDSKDRAITDLFVKLKLPTGFQMPTVRGHIDLDMQMFLFPKLFEHFDDVANGGLTNLSETELKKVRVALFNYGYWRFLGKQSHLLGKFVRNLIKNSHLNRDSTFWEVSQILSSPVWDQHSVELKSIPHRLTGGSEPLVFSADEVQSLSKLGFIVSPN